MNEHQVQQQRAIEALRSGVPNRDAVRALGSTQHTIEARFLEKLALARGGAGAGGLLVGGDFGTGKSHLLEFLQHRALDQRFVVSKVVISKETPLHDPAKVFRSAIEAATLPDRRGEALTEIATSLDFSSPGYAEFYRWTGTREARLDERFAATLFLYDQLGAEDQEFSDRIRRFWAGDAIPVSELKKQLRQCSQAATWTIPKISARELALQRFRFAAGLMRCAGYAGWVLLFDEVELIGRYSLLQRARSYAEIARWVAGFEAEPLPGFAAVLAITADFDEAVLQHKNDLESVPNRLRARGGADDELVAARAEQGMRLIQRDRLPIEPVGAPEREAIYRQLKRIHAEAYDWTPPDVAGVETLGSRPMRQYVRSWINEWDLRRLDPAYQPFSEVEELETEYGQDTALEVPGEGEPGKTEA
ncbi:MAG: ATP-binding protein [Gemmatimonadota bacterium]|nr:ATP-binding protein [Gemmatimonadota bacterium]